MTLSPLLAHNTHTVYSKIIYQYTLNNVATKYIT